MRVEPVVQAGYWGPGKRRSLRLHTNSGLEIVYVHGGQATWQVEGRVEVVPPGSVFFTLPWERHGGVNATEPGVELYFAILRCDREYRRPADRLRFHPSLRMLAHEEREVVRRLRGAARHTYSATDALAWLMPQIVQETTRRELGRGLALSSLARMAVVELARTIDADRPAAPREGDVERRVGRFLRALAEVCGEPWTVEAMAAQCNLRRTRFAELVRELSGDTPIMALNRARVERACRELRDTDLTITQIAMRCGFQSSQYFARVFRDYCGTTPNLYRRQAGGRR